MGDARAPGGGGPRALVRAWVLLGLVAVVAVLALAPPAVGPDDGPRPSGYDPQNARRLLERFAVEPRPAESEGNARGRAVLVEELAALGLAARYETGRVGIDPGRDRTALDRLAEDGRWRPGAGHEHGAAPDADEASMPGPGTAALAVGDALSRDPRFDGPRLVNLVVDLPGEAGRPVVLLSAHHDSVPEGPGAGDDGAGVVALLETLRVLRDAPRRNGLRVLLSDGEELGLLGARLHARAPTARAEALQDAVAAGRDRLGGPAALGVPLVELEPLLAADPADLARELGLPDRLADVGAVVNLEAIGQGGPALLFQTGAASGVLVEAWGEVVAHPTGSSLAQVIYGWMPNDTDLSVYRDRGLPGLNLAIAGGSGHYHRAEDAPEHLDDGTLAHLAETTLALARALAAAELDGEGGERGFLGVPPFGAVVWAGRAHLAAGLLAAALAVRLVVRRAELGVLRSAGLRGLTGALAPAAGALVGGALALGVAAPWLPLTYDGVLVVVAAALVGGLAVQLRWWRLARPDARRAAALLGLGPWLVLLAVFARGDLEVPGAAAPVALAWAGLAAALALPRRTPGLLRTAVLAPAVWVLAPVLVHLVQLATRAWPTALVLCAVLVGLGAVLPAVAADCEGPVNGA